MDMVFEGEPEVLEMFKKAGALLVDDHFVLQAGDHSGAYFNSPELLGDAQNLLPIAKHIALHYRDMQPDFFTVPAVGAIPMVSLVWLCYDQVRWVGAPRARLVYAAKDKDGKFIYTRGMDKAIKGERGVALDDTGTTGDSLRQVIELSRSVGAEICGAGYMVLRSDLDAISLGDVPELYAPAKILIPKYARADCPYCYQGKPINTAYGHGKAYVEQHGQPKAAAGV